MPVARDKEHLLISIAFLLVLETVDVAGAWLDRVRQTHDLGIM